VPAFCDRILWKRNADMKLIHYDSCPTVDFTDHRPVVAHFQLKIIDIRKSKAMAFAEYL
jgi:hypothetical protein